MQKHKMPDPALPTLPVLDSSQTCNIVVAAHAPFARSL